VNSRGLLIYWQEVYIGLCMAYQHSRYIGGLICSHIFPADISIGSRQPHIDNRLQSTGQSE